MASLDLEGMLSAQCWVYNLYHSCELYVTIGFFIANALHAKCKLCHKSKVYPYQPGNSPQWHSGQFKYVYFSNNMLKICVCLWVKFTSTGWVRNLSRRCGISTLGVKQPKVALLVLTKVLNGFRQKIRGLTDKTTTDDVLTTDGWSHKGYQLIVN